MFFSRDSHDSFSFKTRMGLDNQLRQNNSLKNFSAVVEDFCAKGT